jgi:hypothetical protein
MYGSGGRDVNLPFFSTGVIFAVQDEDTPLGRVRYIG